MKRLTLLLFCGLMACQRSSGTIAIAAAGPWQEGYGAMNKLGVQFAVEQINANGGIHGTPLTLIDRDDEADGAKAARIAQEFVDNPQIVGVVGHVTSGSMVAAAKVYDGHLAAIATSATAPELTGISPWAFRVISSDSANGVDLAKFAAQFHAAKAAILYENNPYGRGLSSAFRDNYNGDIVSIDPIADDGTGIAPFIAYYKQKGVSLVFVAGVEVSGMAILKEARQEGLQAHFIGADGWTGILADSVSSEGAFVGAPFTPLDPHPEAQAFVKAFRQRFNKDPDGNAALAYDATMLLGKAINAVGPDRRKVRDWLASLTDENAPTGVTGKLRFAPTGDPIGKSFVMTRVHDGALLVEAQ